MTAVEDYLQSKKVKQQEEFNAILRANLRDATSTSSSRSHTISETSSSRAQPQASRLPDTPLPSQQSPLPRPVNPMINNYGPQYTQQMLTLYHQDPNGPLIYDMMANRSSRWRAKNMRSSILPPGWKMGISRLGRVPVYDPLYQPMPPPRAPVVREAVVTRGRDPYAGMIRGITMEEGLVPRYQATDPQYDHDLDQYNLGLPRNLAALHHESKSGRGAENGGGGGGGVRRGGGPWIPPNSRGRGGVRVVAEDILDEPVFEEEIIEPRDILQCPVVVRRATYPIHDTGHLPAHIPPQQRSGGHHRPGHGHGHGHGHEHGHNHGRDAQNYTIRRGSREEDDLAREFENVGLHDETDRDVAEIAALQDQMDLRDAARRAEHQSLRDGEALLRHERAARAATEHELRVREQQLAASEAERVAEELAHHGHAHGRPGHGHHRLVHPRHSEHGGPRIIRDRHGRDVAVDKHQHHHELIHVPRDIVDPHHKHHENISHIGHLSPPPHRPARHVHFADDFTSSEEERMERHRHKLAQETHPLRRRFDRDGRPYLFHEDELDYAREEFYDDETYHSNDEYYLPHQRLLMPPRVVRGNYWEEYVDTNDD